MNPKRTFLAITFVVVTVLICSSARADFVFGTPTNLGPLVNSPSEEGCASISDDGLELYFRSNRTGDNDIWVSKRATIQADWGPGERLAPGINSPASDLCVDLSPDGLVLILTSARAGSYGGVLGDLWMARRPSIHDPWGLPINLGPIVNTPYNEIAPALSPDGSTLYFISDRPGGRGDLDLWQVSLSPVVDFNGDEIVDVQDLLQLIESWGQDDPSVDVGPMPWGDGKVDAKDLEVLMSRWGQEPALVAHWKLDEYSGTTAADSVGTNEGNLLGGPLWQPGGGKVGGALQFDGVDDHLATGFACNPSVGPFSVFLWIKGGTPGQVLVSQVGSTNWLRAAPTGGKLQTELNEPSRNAASKHLLSPVVITDDAWHRVGLVWDGTNRVLYVDDVEVARGTLTGLPDSTAGLYLGAGSTLAPGSFWSGLIDDVRIYDRAVKP